jgi:hypothetical protein
MNQGLSLTSEALKIAIRAQAMLLLHTMLARSGHATSQASGQLDTQPLTALAAPGLDHPSPALGLHAGPETVAALAAPYFGLPCAFRHFFTSFLV